MSARLQRVFQAVLFSSDAPIHFYLRINEQYSNSSHLRGIFTRLPVTTAQWSKPVDSCVCCTPASWWGSTGRNESQPGSPHQSGSFSGHTGPAVSAPLLHSFCCTPPTLLQTSWDNTMQSHWVDMHSSSIVGICEWKRDNCTIIWLIILNISLYILLTVEDAAGFGASQNSQAFKV